MVFKHTLIYFSFTFLLFCQIQQEVDLNWNKLKIFQMNLPKLEKRGYLQDLESVFFDSDSNSKSLFDLKILNYEGKDTNPCEVKNRKVELKSQVLVNNEKSGFSYRQLYTTSNMAIILIDNFTLEILQFAENPVSGVQIFNKKDANLNDFLKLPINLEKLNSCNVIIIESEDQQFIHIIFDIEMYSFSKQSIFSQQEIKFFINEGFQPVEQVNAALYSKGNLYVASDQGLFVYKLDSNTNILTKLAHYNTRNHPIFNSEENEIGQFNLQDLAVNENHLFIADYYNGIYIIETNSNIEQNKFVIHIDTVKFVKRLSLHSDIIIAVGETAIVSFVKEIFFNVKNKEFFVNRNYEDESYKWQDVKINDSFAFIQGQSYNMIFYSGIHKFFYPQNEKYSDFSSGIAMKQTNRFNVIRTSPIDSNYRNYISIGLKKIHAVQLVESPFKLECQSNNINQIGDNKMGLEYQTSFCEASSQKSIDLSIWTSCNIQQEFNFHIKTVLVDSDDQQTVGYIAAIIILAILIIAMIVTYVICIFMKRVKKTNDQLIEYKTKYMQLHQQNNGSAQIMSDNQDLFKSINQMNQPSSSVIENVGVQMQEIQKEKVQVKQNK